MPIYRPEDVGRLSELRGGSQCFIESAATRSMIARQQNNPDTDTSWSSSAATALTLFVLNAASTVKLNAIEQLTAKLLGYHVDIALISETHLKTEVC